MGHPEDRTEQGAVGSPPYSLEPWNPNGIATVTVEGQEPEAVLLAGLRGVLAAARGDQAQPGIEADDSSGAAPIRGQGSDLGRVFAELAADLLAQLDANGPGMDRVRLDGILETDDGGYSAWGYLLGTPSDNPPPVGISLDGEPAVSVATSAGLQLRCTLRRG